MAHGLAVAFLDLKAGDAAALSGSSIYEKVVIIPSSDRWYGHASWPRLESELPTEAKRSGLDGDTDLIILGRTSLLRVQTGSISRVKIFCFA